jgi:hypothetical protein
MTNPIDPNSGAYPNYGVNNTPQPSIKEAFSTQTDPFASFKAFLGEEGYQKFLQIYLQEIINQVNKEAAKIKKMDQKLKRVFSGQDAD